MEREKPLAVAFNDQHRVCAAPDGTWRAYLNGDLVTGLQGEPIMFAGEADARAFLEEADARSSSIDN